MNDNDPMNFAIDLGGRVDTTPPCPIAGSYVATLANAERKENKAQTGFNLVLTFELEAGGQALPSTSGEPKTFAPGFKLTEYLPLQQSATPNAPDFRQKLCRIYDAIAGTDDDTRPASLPFGSLQGKRLILVTEPQNDPTYGFQPRIKKFQRISE